MSVLKSDFKVGDRVSHSKLGEGDILDLYPYGEDTVAVISFEKWGQKKIVMRYAKLTIVIPPEEEEEPEEEEKPRKKAKAKAKKTAKKAAKAKKPAKKAAKTAKKTTKKAKKKAKKK